MQHAVGLDIGHSAVKVAAMYPILFPTAVTPAIDVGVDGARATAEYDTVAVDGKSYFVGDTALVQSGGHAIDSLSDSWIGTNEYLALMKVGYVRGRKQLATEKAALGLGLPSRLYNVQKERTRESAAATLGISPRDIVVLPQPLAAFYSRLLNDKGMPATSNEESSRWIVIDIGYYTTDFGWIENDVWSSVGQESTRGMHVAAQHLRKLVGEKIGLDLPLRDANAALVSKTVLDQGDQVDVSELVKLAADAEASMIVDAAMRIFGESQVRGANGVYVAGGGALLLFDAIKAVWKHAVMPDQPRIAVAEGLRRAALAWGLARS